jgi:hypothetical protein
MAESIAARYAARWEALKAQDLESQRKTAEALARLRALAADLEALDFSEV